MQEVKAGRNDPCPCGKLQSNGRPIKYKRCHGSGLLSERLVRISRADFISGPFTECPNCKANTFGIFISTGGTNSYTKECTKCGHTKSYSLPKIKKRIIYLDQFVIDNIVKSLDPEHPKHNTVIKDSFWIKVYSKLDALLRAQLIICPDSFFHKDESAPTGYFRFMRRIYEHFSGGATFTNNIKIAEDQITFAFDCFLKNTRPLYNFEPERVVFGELHEWNGTIQISVGTEPRENEVKNLLQSKSQTYKQFLETFARWQTEHNKEFDDWFKEESLGYARGIMLSIKNYYQRQAAAPIKYQQTGNIDLNDIFPPLTVDILTSMQKIARQNGIQDENILHTKIGEFFASDKFSQIPIVNIGSLIYAALADQAARGRTRLPSPGVIADVDMISSIMPYCEAIFVDKENASILADSRVAKRLPYPTKIFSLRNRQAFLDYLDQILADTDPEHIKFVEQVYGKKWKDPFLSILIHERHEK